jgi:hypothetical protein
LAIYFNIIYKKDSNHYYKDFIYHFVLFILIGLLNN